MVHILAVGCNNTHKNTKGGGGGGGGGGGASTSYLTMKDLENCAGG